MSKKIEILTPIIMELIHKGQFLQLSKDSDKNKTDTDGITMPVSK